MKNQPSNDNNNTGATGPTADGQSGNLVRGAERWLDEHGNPDYSYLKALAGEGTQEALEALKAIANDHNVSYDAGVTAQQLVDKIILATQQEEGDESM